MSEQHIEQLKSIELTNPSNPCMMMTKPPACTGTAAIHVSTVFATAEIAGQPLQTDL